MNYFLRKSITVLLFVFAGLQSHAQAPGCNASTILWPTITVANRAVPLALVNGNVTGNVCIPHGLNNNSVAVQLALAAENPSVNYALSYATNNPDWVIQGNNPANPNPWSSWNVSFNLLVSNSSGDIVITMRRISAGAGCCSADVLPIYIHINRPLAAGSAILGNQCLSYGNINNEFWIQGQGGRPLGNIIINWTFPDGNPNASPVGNTPIPNPLGWTWRGERAPRVIATRSGANATGGFITANSAGCENEPGNVPLRIPILYRNTLTGFDWTPHSTINDNCYINGICTRYSVNAVVLPPDNPETNPNSPTFVNYYWGFPANWAYGANCNGAEPYSQLPTPAPGLGVPAAYNATAYPGGPIRTTLPQIWLIPQPNPQGPFGNQYFSLENKINFAGLTCGSMTSVGIVHNGCNFTSRLANPKSETIEVPAIKGMKLKPNPAGDFTTVLLGAEKINATIKLMDGNGKLLLSKAATGSSTKLETGKLPNGVYNVVVIEGKGETMTEKLVIAK